MQRRQTQNVFSCVMTHLLVILFTTTEHLVMVVAAVAVTTITVLVAARVVVVISVGRLVAVAVDVGCSDRCVVASVATRTSTTKIHEQLVLKESVR